MIHPKIAESIEQLWVRHPFFAEIASFCRYIPSQTIPTAGVYISKEGFNFSYNPKFIDGLNIKQVNYLMIHEMAHLISNHQLRRELKNLDPLLVNIAADCIINSEIEKTSGMGVYLERVTEDLLLVPKEYQGEWIMEDLYDWLLQDSNMKKVLGKHFDEHCEHEVTAQEAAAMVGPMIKAMKERGLDPGDFNTLVMELQRPVDNPLARMKKALSALISHVKERTWAKPSIIGVGKGFSRQAEAMTVLLDTSGSMEGAFDKVISFLLLKGVTVNLIQCDAKVQATKKIVNLHEYRKLAIKGLGGTVLQPGVNYAKNNYPKLPLVILTDGYTDDLNLLGFKFSTTILTVGQEVPIQAGKAKQFVIKHK